MIEVRGIPLFVDELEILYEIKRQVFAQQGREILKKIKKSGNNIMVCCPNHKNGQERNPSCGILIERTGDRPAGTAHCFACGYVGTFDNFIAKCFGVNDSNFGTNWLLENFANIELETRKVLIPDITRQPKQTIQKYITEEELQNYRYYHPYMFQRKLTKEVIEKYDVGYQKDFRPEGWNNSVEVLTFPVRDAEGNCLFISRRAIYNKTFFLPPDGDKFIYGLYELPKRCSKLIICESVINALTCATYNLPALALFGTGCNEQYEILNNLPVRHLVIGLDPDRAGNRGTEKLKYKLKGKILTKLILPNGKDLNDLSEEEFKNLNEKYI